MKKFSYLFVLGVVLFAILGCSKVSDSIGKLQAELNKDVAIAQNDVPNNNEENTTNGDGEISIDETYQIVPTEAGVKEPTMSVDLYFASSDAKKLVKVSKEISKKEGKARATIEALLQGPDKDSELISAIPSGTKLLDINIKDGLCIVDFSEQFSDSGKGLVEENLALQSVTQSLCQFDSIDKVEFRVNGVALEKLNNTAVSKEVFCDMSILQ